jgi:hypothetical protein
LYGRIMWGTGVNRKAAHRHYAWIAEFTYLSASGAKKAAPEGAADF